MIGSSPLERGFYTVLVLTEVRSVPGAGHNFCMHPEVHASICRAGDVRKAKCSSCRRRCFPCVMSGTYTIHGTCTMSGTKWIFNHLSIHLKCGFTNKMYPGVCHFFVFSKLWVPQSEPTGNQLVAAPVKEQCLNGKGLFYFALKLVGACTVSFVLGTWGFRWRVRS